MHSGWARTTLLICLASVALQWSAFGHQYSHEVDANAIKPWGGHAYVVTMPWLSHHFPLRSPGDSPAKPSASTLVLYEDDRALGPSHSLHNDIKTAGGGRYSHWGGLLIFAAHDNSDPRTNGLRYRMEWTARLSWAVTVPLLGILVWWHRRFLARCGHRIVRIPGIGWTLINVAPGLLIGLFVAGLLSLLGETYFRLTLPFTTTNWPTRFVPNVGWTFAPGEEVRHTNNLDFWTATRVNSLGFLDHEPPRRNGAACRVALIGDSFVEAAQVPIERKVQVLLEQNIAMRHPDWHLVASAFGYSGTGQLNQLPFYDHFVQPQHPHLVVLVFVNNDFANNSTLLESVRNGWHPLHPPRLFARRSKDNGSAFALIPIDTDWRTHLLPFTQRVAKECAACSWHETLMTRSMFYRWLVAVLKLEHPDLFAGLEGTNHNEAMQQRLAWLRDQPEFRNDLADWQVTRDEFVNVDEPFWQPRLPAVFEDALDATDFALSEFKRRADSENARLVILATSSLYRNDHGRPNDLAFRRLTELAARHGIEVLDQYIEAQTQGVDVKTLSFPHDGHWSPLGHRVAADLILKYMDKTPDFCPVVGFHGKQSEARR